jgi:2-polyprenyl-3-methyl-5-hydroxy-6-metoxy-1,4-benzoquinol methylase
MIDKKSAHEAVYQTLVEKQYEGWGGSKYKDRMAGWDDNIDKILRESHLVEGKILELGCGAGDVSIKLAQRGFDVVGIDFSITAIKWANEKAAAIFSKTAANFDFEKIRFFEADVTDDNLLTDEQFDLIIDGNCLHCLFDEARASFYNNVKRLIKHSGYFFVASAIMAPNAHEKPKISEIDRCLLSKEALEQELADNGFIVLNTWVIEHETHHHYRGLLKVRPDDKTL